MLSPLPNLPALAPFQAAADSAVSTAASVAGSAATSVEKTVLGGYTITQWVMIVLGMLLIAAGIFQFDKARAVIVKAGKAATETAAAAA